MRVAVLADIHANLPALRAVLAEAARLGAEHTVCLGDLVGYNAQPGECVELVRAEVPLVVAGNHDRAVSGAPSAAGTNQIARQVIDWTRQQLDADSLRYLAALPNSAIDPSGLLCVHGCFLNTKHFTGYVTGTMLEANLRVVVERADARIALCGHTHIPMCGWLVRDECVEHRLTEPAVWPANADAVLVNPGAVGQPRDGDPRAAFALLDTAARRVEVFRVPYNIEQAASAITRAGLPAVLADRLRAGR